MGIVWGKAIGYKGTNYFVKIKALNREFYLLRIRVKGNRTCGTIEL